MKRVVDNLSDDVVRLNDVRYDKMYLAHRVFSGAGNRSVGIIHAKEYRREPEDAMYSLYMLKGAGSAGLTRANGWLSDRSSLRDLIEDAIDHKWEVEEFDTPLEYAERLVELLK